MSTLPSIIQRKLAHHSIRLKSRPPFFSNIRYKPTICFTGQTSNREGYSGNSKVVIMEGATGAKGVKGRCE